MLPVLFKVVLSFESFSAELACERYVILVTPLVDHEVIGFGEPSLTVFANEFALRSHFAAEFSAPLFGAHLHHGEHPDVAERKMYKNSEEVVY